MSVHRKLPTGWTVARLAEVCREITVGHVGPMADQYEASGIPFLRSQNILPFRLSLEDVKYIPANFHTKLKKSALSPGDVAIVRTGYPGTACVIPPSLKDANCADLVIVRPSEKLNPWFLVAVLNSSWGRSSIAGNLVGAAQQHFNVGAAKAMQIALPPLYIQRRIASILTAYDDLIENNTRRIAILEEMARRIYEEWFVRFRFPGHEGVPMVESELGPVPNKWRVRAFDEIATFTNGYAFRPDDWSNEGLPIIKIKELKTGVQNDTPRYAKSLPEKYHVKHGDLMFSWSADLDVYIWNDGEGWLNQHLFLVQSRELSTPKSFLYHSLKEAMPSFRTRSNGATMKHIKRSALSEVVVMMPPIELTTKFDHLVRPLHELVMLLSRKNANLRTTRDLLLPKLISGELDVSELPVPEAAAA